MSPALSPALVHDYLLVLRGAERTFAEMARAWPGAPIYTTAYAPEMVAAALPGRRVSASRLQRLRVGQRRFRVLLPIYPKLVESLPLTGHDLVISSSSAFAHGVRVSPDATHVCYCHTPFRYAWHEHDRTLEEAPRAVRPLLSKVLADIREWDLRAAERVTRYVANSELTRERIREAYGREAGLVHPPVDVQRFEGVTAPPDAGRYFLLVTELVGHKRVDVALEAAQRAGVRMKVVGDGPELKSLRARFGAIAELTGRIDDGQVATALAGARALVVPNVEEFGIAVVEAHAAGTPVIAQNAGGARETVSPGRTGVLVDGSSAEAFASALERFDSTDYSARDLRESAHRFSPERFRRRLREEVELALAS